MITASDFADWWDTQNKETKDALGDFVEAYPNIFAIGFAVQVATVTDYAAGAVDVLRLGKGAVEGGFGYVSDFFRFLSVLGPLGKTLKMIGGGITRRIGLLLKDPAPAKGICTWVAAAKALRHSGSGQLFAKVDDVAKLMGRKVPPAQLGGIWADDLVPALRAMGAKVKNLGQPTSINHVLETAKNVLPKNGAMLFAVKWNLHLKKPPVHTLYAFKDAMGRIRMSDRTGKVATTLADYERHVPAWKGIANAVVATSGQQGAMLVIEGPQMLYLNSAMTVAGLCIGVNAVTALNLDEIDSLDELDAEWLDFLRTKRPKNQWKISAVKLPPVQYLTGVRFRLKELGEYKGPIRGKYDGVTRSAVVRFQTKNGLRPDGIPGPKTQAKLAQVYGA